MKIFLILLPVKKNALMKFIKSLLPLTACPKKHEDLKPVGTSPEIKYGSIKNNIHKKCVDDCRPFRPTLSALQTPIHKLAKYLAPILEPLTKNKYAVKDSFNFST